MAHDVFISYSSKDKPVADSICTALEAEGIRCWISPRDIVPGRAYSGQITRAIEQSHAMVLLFSSNSNTSEDVLREVQLAANARLRILNFKIEDVAPSDDMEYFLSVPHWLDATTPPLEQHLAQLVGSLEALLEAANRSPPFAPRTGPATPPVAQADSKVPPESSSAFEADSSERNAAEPHESAEDELPSGGTFSDVLASSQSEPVLEQAAKSGEVVEKTKTEHILPEQTEIKQTAFDKAEVTESPREIGEAFFKKLNGYRRKRFFLLFTITFVIAILASGVLVLFLTESKKVKFGDKFFLRSREGSYVIAAYIGKYNWPRLGKTGKVPLTLRGNGPVRHQSVVQIQSLENNLNGSDVLGAFPDTSICYYERRGYEDRNQSWIVAKIDVSDPVLRYGDKIYLQNVYYNNKRLTKHPQNTDYLAVEEGVDWWWVLEKEQLRLA